MQPIVFIIHIIAAVTLVALVLMQHGKGADAGAAFGSGASQTMFGSLGTTPFLIKVTALVAAIFFASCLTLGYLTAKDAKQAKSTFQQEKSLSTVPFNIPVKPEVPKN